MSVSNAFKAAQPYVVGIGVPLSVGALAVILPIQFAQQTSIAIIQTKVDDAKASLDKVSDKIQQINEHLTESESDPSKLIAKLLGTSAVNVNLATFAYVNGKLFALPKNAEASERFVAAGYSLEPISPTISGYALEKTVVK